ncbi:MAG: saccharopine dehydrogenase [Candidatus Zixiibacteriota bacterium]|nr:MAG: saccharopine dehydrogenase [candidate division Zixibacteria bacterium]
MKIAIIGAGLMGRAAAFDAARADNVETVGVFDIDGDAAKAVAQQYGNNKASGYQLDAEDEAAVATALETYDAAVSCVTYRMNPALTRAAIRAKCHLVDLGGNNDVVRTQLAMDPEAKEAGVIIIPDCGLAPGMVSVLVADAVQKLDSVASVKIRVGGLPQSPRPPLNYQMVFSAEGLINEYWEPCLILDGGQKKTVEPMTAVEQLTFDGVGELEAFYTSGGTSTLPDTYEGQIDFLDYKTIRYPGHCQLFRPMLEIGLASRKKLEVDGQMVEPRAVFKKVLETNLTFNEPDLVLVRVTARGRRNDTETTLVYEIIDRQDDRSGLTAMMRTTAFPASVIALMAASGRIETRGVNPQERVVNPALFITELKKRGIKLNVREEAPAM